MKKKQRTAINGTDSVTPTLMSEGSLSVSAVTFGQVERSTDAASDGLKVTEDRTNTLAESYNATDTFPVLNSMRRKCFFSKKSGQIVWTNFPIHAATQRNR